MIQTNVSDALRNTDFGHMDTNFFERSQKRKCIGTSLKEDVAKPTRKLVKTNRFP